MWMSPEQQEVIHGYLVQECATGLVVGPLARGSLPQIQISRIGVILKGSTGRWRLIVYLSAPEGYSINDGIASPLCSLSYVSVRDAVSAICRLGRSTLMAKVDIRSAYRTVPVHPEDRWLLGMWWDNNVYINTVLPFGLHSTPKIFNALADAAEWIIREEGVKEVLHYLDNFLLLGAPNVQVLWLFCWRPLNGLACP